MDAAKREFAKNGLGGARVDVDNGGAEDVAGIVKAAGESGVRSKSGFVGDSAQLCDAGPRLVHGI